MDRVTKKKFDFSKFKQRHIALKLLYFGWDYDGLAAQTNSPNTIEYHLFDALTKSCLVESRDSCKFNRCGRTDKGVSSYGQVVNLNIRSNLVDENDPRNIGLFTPDNYTGSSSCDNETTTTRSREEINYVDILNRLMPAHIKVISWAPTRENFSSRFDCQSRSYSYVFPRGDLCVSSMNDAAKHLIGQHDFRNLCSFDIKNGVVNHQRRIIDAKVEPINSPVIPEHSYNRHPESPYSFYEVVIVGQAFLYHQIRCIMTVLFLVGRKKEPPTLVRDLLDIERCPARPKYCRASPLPLSLFDCQYRPQDFPLGWICDEKSLFNTFRQLKQLWLSYKTKTVMIERVLLDLDSDLKLKQNKQELNTSKLDSWKDFGLEHDNMSDNKYVPMLNRPCEDPLDAKIEAMNVKKKLKTWQNQDNNS